ncbi:hypothetical protein [Metaclostridioides mangenotii]|uniref:hypothetical protein n=1 Tax=Metaclostridioides mangenotii TaxID=1540 RepID=UPI0004655114|nr:hypothetical protein [Clostridioides mangenotii]
MEEMVKSAKIIAIGDEGINNLKHIEKDIIGNMDTEKIEINQDVDKEYIRSIFDGIEMLFLIYSSEDKRTSDIVKAISYMSSERRVLSIGINTLFDDKKEDMGVNREFRLHTEELSEFTNMMNLIVESISDLTLLYLDITDLKEVIANEKGIGYSYVEFKQSDDYINVAKNIIDSMKSIGNVFLNKKSLMLIEGKISLEDVNKLTDCIYEIKEENYDIIFSLNLKENDDNKVKIGLIHN